MDAREQRNTLTIDGQQVTKCAIVGCVEPMVKGGCGLTFANTATTVEYGLCAVHGDMLARHAALGNEVEPWWNFPAGNWHHDGRRRG